MNKERRESRKRYAIVFTWRIDMIKLYKNKEDICNFIRNGLMQFQDDYPNEKVSSFAIYACPWAGWITSNFDTNANSESLINQQLETGNHWYGSDVEGYFNNNCPDFLYSNYSELQFEKWAEEYNNGDTISIKINRISKKIVNVDVLGDEAFNRIFFDFFVKILDEIIKEDVFISLNKSEIFRFGLQMLDSECILFKIVKTIA